MRSRINFVLFIAAAALTLVIADGCSKDKATVRPTHRTITQAVYASGKIFPVGFYRASSKVPGVVEEVLVTAGDTVAKGQALLRIRAVSSELAVATAQEAYGLASENASGEGALLRSVAADLESARARLLLDSTNAARLRRLLSQQATSQSAYDVAQTQFDVSRRQFEKAYDGYVATKRRLATEKKAAELNVSIQRSLRDEFILTAAESGRVYDVLPKVGELVMPQQPLVEIGNSSLVEVELNVDEADVALIVPGQSVVYAVDAFKDRTFTGSVTSVTPRVSNQDKTASVTARINTGGLRLLPGMSLEANIVVDRRAKALVLPRELVPSTKMLTVRRDGKEQIVRVTTGLEDLRFIEIVSGLTDSDEVVK
ncbi:MAG: HlyD family efflux transporter periplasmic adaptor subunit [Candidatus Kapabacteria bacterium]|nr:HlyD family efflux transporter periplasmic adaptor subunit [Candidatus Kapabacteria bacterium]